VRIARPLLKTLRSLLVSVVLFAWAPSLAAQGTSEKDSCDRYTSQPIPKFRVAKKFRNEPKPGLSLFISISPSAFQRDKLLALVCDLGRRHAKEESLFVFVLNSYKAASQYNGSGEGEDYETMTSPLVFYAFLRHDGTGNQSMAWSPDRYNASTRIHIDLGEPPPRPAKH
jgi:hypothetical protein